jgi:hypothetical protein
VSSVERPEQVTSAGPDPDTSTSQFFTDVYTGAVTDIKDVATKIAEHPKEAAAIGAMAVGAVATIWFTRGRALTGIFRSGAGEEATISKAANPELLAPLRAAQAKDTIPDLLASAREPGGKSMMPGKRDVASFEGGDDPYGPDPHDEQHDPNLPANQWEQQMKPPSGPYGDDPFANMEPVKLPLPSSETGIRAVATFHQSPETTAKTLPADAPGWYTPPRWATDAAPKRVVGPVPMRTVTGFSEHVEAYDRWRYQASSYDSLIPSLVERYGSRPGLNVLEIGPNRTTAVAHALAPNSKLYLGLDLGPEQQKYLTAEGLQNAKAVVGDLYNMPVAANSQDVVFASRTTPLGSVYATRESLTRAYSEIARVLKPDGEFVQYPEPRKELASFDPAQEIFREIKRIPIPPNPGNRDLSWMLIFGKR